jgi:L-asparaginase
MKAFTMPLRLIATGGTFDKHYDPIAGQLGFADTHLHAIVERARVAGDVVVEVAMLVDSLDMTDAHRQAVLEACRAAPETAIVVVHGTDTMVETARVLGAARLPKTIVLTGAMVPCEVEGSDALFNLGFAIACAHTLGEGVWIAMNAAAHRWDAVRKNRALGRFEALAGDA